MGYCDITPFLNGITHDVLLIGANIYQHPLDDAGYVSIGCQPCTRSYEDDLDGRGGRWAGLNKTECGLHTTLGGGS